VEIVIPKEFKVLWETNEERPVVKYPADVLRRKAEPVERVNKEIRRLIERMGETIKTANGVGLAAPQVGVSKRVILVAPNSRDPIALINPEIVYEDGIVVGQEGCLSLPGLYGDVERRAIVEVKALNPEGKQIKLRFEGLGSRAVQHEIDHLDGILFIDKVDVETLHWAWPAGADAA
jgi:peptide deformylase